jgi:hypothetical protein
MIAVTFWRLVESPIIICSFGIGKMENYSVPNEQQIETGTSLLMSNIRSTTACCSACVATKYTKHSALLMIR